MRSQLRRTWAFLTLSLVFVLPVGVLTLWDSFEYLFPRCTGTLEGVQRSLVATMPTSDDDVLTLDHERDGLILHLDTEVDLDNRVVSARMVRVGADARGRRCECGSIKLRDAGVSGVGYVSGYGNGVYQYTDAKWGMSQEAFRFVERSTRHLQRRRVFTGRTLPALAVLLALGAIAVAERRTRRAAVYVTEVSSWTLARLDAGGRVEEAESGEVLGVFDGTEHGLESGAVLVAPNASAGQAVYRDQPVLTAASVAVGSHEQWRRATLRRLGSARALATLSAACAAAGLVAILLHP